MAQTTSCNENGTESPRGGDDEQLFNDTLTKILPSEDRRDDEHCQYRRSISSNQETAGLPSSSFQRSKSIVNECQHVEETIGDFQSVPSVKPNESEDNTTRRDYPLSIRRLLEPNCQGIRERIELLGELLISKKLDPIPDVYDEMAQIISATERNERFQAGPDGEQLLHFTTAAKSNRNIDLSNLDDEIHRQFGLYSVEVTGDGACAFRAILISGLQKPDVFNSELREAAVQQVLGDMPYYSTVLKPGEKTSEKELRDWASFMSDPNTYADEMANIAIADHYHVQLVIFRAGELLTVVNPRDGDVEHTAFLVNVGTHYKALVARHELTTARQNSERLCRQSRNAH